MKTLLLTRYSYAVTLASMARCVCLSVICPSLCG